MRLCILCEDKNIDAARANSKNIFPAEKPILNLPDRIKDLAPKAHLNTACSETGELPATHWFCFISCDQATRDRMVGNALYSTIEEASPKEFLERWNLKVIR